MARARRPAIGERIGHIGSPEAGLAVLTIEQPNGYDGQYRQISRTLDRPLETNSVAS